MRIKNCKKCSGDLGPGAIVCSHCGEKINRGPMALRIIAIISALLAIALSFIPDEKNNKASFAAENKNSTFLTEPQQRFELARTGKLQEYKDASNEIQKSRIFNQANKETKIFISQYGSYINQWVGTISSISTSHGGSEVSVKIKSFNGVTYGSNPLEPILSSSPIYHQLSILKEGQVVQFSGSLLPHDGENWEYSFTERGSLEEPDFIISFESINLSSQQSQQHSAILGESNKTQSPLIDDRVPSTAPVALYHVKDSGPIGCNEQKITAEINDAIKHPGSLSDNAFSSISAAGQCSPLSPNVELKLIRFETLTLPTGIQKVAYVLLSASNSPPDYLYVMQDDIEKTHH